MLRPEYSGTTWSLPWLLMSRPLASPGMNKHRIKYAGYRRESFFHNERFQLPVRSQCWEIIKDTNIFLWVFFKCQGLIYYCISNCTMSPRLVTVTRVICWNIKHREMTMWGKNCLHNNKTSLAHNMWPWLKLIFTHIILINILSISHDNGPRTNATWSQWR